MNIKLKQNFNIAKAIPVLNTLWLQHKNFNTGSPLQNINKKGKNNNTGQLSQPTIINSIIIGLKKGWSTPTLPENIKILQKHPLIRILRFLGGSSILILLSHRYLNCHIYILYLLLFITIIYVIYKFIISYFRIKHAIKVFKSKELNIKKPS
jgi:hypothetical protein